MNNKIASENKIGGAIENKLAVNSPSRVRNVPNTVSSDGSNVSNVATTGVKSKSYGEIFIVL